MGKISGVRQAGNKGREKSQVTGIEEPPELSAGANDVNFKEPGINIHFQMG